MRRNPHRESRVSTALPSSPLPTCVGCSQTAIPLVTLFWKTMPAANCAPLGPPFSAYSFGEVFANLASPTAVFLGLAAALFVLAAPALILRYERRLLAKVERALPALAQTPCQAGAHVRRAATQPRCRAA